MKAFVREDGAWLGSIDIAIKKAKTSRYFDMDTDMVGQLSQPGKDLYMIEVSNQGEWSTTGYSVCRIGAGFLKSGYPVGESKNFQTPPPSNFSKKFWTP